MSSQSTQARDTESRTWKTIQTVDFFKTASLSFLCEITRMLETKVFYPQEFIIRQGDDAGCMYFLEHGAAEVRVNGVPVATITSGGCFGEMALISEGKRHACVYVLETCYVKRLAKDKFELMRSKYPEFDRYVTAIAEARAVANSQMATAYSKDAGSLGNHPRNNLTKLN